MAKKEEVVIVPLTKKQKILNALKVVGISLGAVVGVVAAVILYVWLSGGFNPPYVPLTEMHFSKNEYVISELDNIALVPNEGCTELDNVVLTIEDTNIAVLVEDDYTTAITNKNEQTGDESEAEPQQEGQETEVVNKYHVTIGQNIQIQPVKQTINAGTENEKQINVGGWVKLTAERELIQTHCWVFVDVPVESLELFVQTDLEKLEPEQNQPAQEEPEQEEPAQPLETYIVYPSSTIQLGVTNHQPAKAFNLPSTSLSNFPNGKTTTEFNNIKKVYYVVSDETLATVDSNTGIVTVKQIVQGSFKVYAYVVARYNDVGNEPNLEDYVNEFGEANGFANWEQDFDLIRVKTQEIEFKIKDIEVESLTVAKEKLTYNLLSNNNKVQVNFSNSASNIVDAEHSNVYHYAVDIALSYESDSKGVLFENIKLFAGYIDNNTTEQAVFVNGNYIVLDDTYIKISEPTINHDVSPRQLSWDVVINEYKASGNVLVFAYPVYNEQGEVEDYIYDYAEIEINKVPVEGLVFNNVEKEINLKWSDVQGAVETKDLSGTVAVNPSNATYGRYVQYFALADNKIIETDSKIKIKTIDNKEYYAICKTGEDGEKAYNVINPIGYGSKTSVAAVVLIQDANGELITHDGYYLFDYIGNLSDSISVSVTKNILVTGVDVLDADGNSIKKGNTVTVAKGETFVLEISCDETIINDAAFVWAIEGDENQNAISQTNNVRVEDKKLVYTLTANRDAVVAIYIADENGNKVTYIENINIEILNTELQALALSTNATNGVSVKLTSTEYAWKIVDANGNVLTDDLKFGVTYSPVNTNNKTVSVGAYQLPENFDETQLDSLSPETLQISDVLTFEQSYDNGAEILPVINKPGKVIVFAASLSGEIVSNPVIVEITIPDIKVEFYGENSQQIIAVDGIVKSLTAYDKIDELDGKQGDKYRIGVYEKTQDTSVDAQKQYYTLQDGSYVLVDNPSTIYLMEYYEFIDISSLVSYKFAGEYTTDENGIITSQAGTKIDNMARTLTLCNIDADTQEIIVMCTEFGFETTEAQSFIYNLVADYSVVTTSSEYFAPSLIDIFGDGSVKFTNKAGNILYLPEGYDVSTLDANYVNGFEEVRCTLSINLHGTYCSPDFATGKIKIYRIPEDVTNIVAVISVVKPDGTNGYTAQYTFTIKPAVSSNFEANGYDDNKNQVLVVDTAITEGQNGYEFTNGNVVNLIDSTNPESSKLKYNNLNDSTITINNIKFSEGYISLVGMEILNNQVVEYKLAKEASAGFDASQTYYTKTDNGFVKVENATEENFATYYQTEVYAELNGSTLSLNNSLLQHDIADFQVKLEVQATVVKDGITTKITSYYIIKFELPKGN